MPELPEVEITARRLAAALEGAEVESILAPGMVAVKTLDPPLSALQGMTVAGTLIINIGYGRSQDYSSFNLGESVGQGSNTTNSMLDVLRVLSND